jgi:hypothetical protein
VRPLGGVDRAASLATLRAGVDDDPLRREEEDNGDEDEEALVPDAEAEAAMMTRTGRAGMVFMAVVGWFCLFLLQLCL